MLVVVNIGAIAILLKCDRTKILCKLRNIAKLPALYPSTSFKRISYKNSSFDS
ncbi:hypothetical protein COO91_06141 [Nostoc flagelliforme CCNUN1]|uniref:Uncharacterized protein n=1 Tax=Nostoc flagelliforme CCNUN1 TaxID=2038116 RepID=A0A2K8SXH6_9NOSO|nr:hypothetical protein COO91_06141 [Nostoc flagelliforme CCNUN1]